MQKVLVVDNSALMRRSLCDIINADEDFHVIDMSLNGEDAYNKIKESSYDLVVMEMVLPRMDGLTVLARLNEEGNQTKIIAISTSIKEEAEETVRALELGAYDFVKRPARICRSDSSFADRLLETMHAAVNDRFFKKKTVIAARDVRNHIQSGNCQEIKPTTKVVSNGKPQLIALACSTGGPQALHKMIPMLPANLSVPLVLVQHMPAGFTAALADRLNQTSKIHVKEAVDGEILKAGCVYIAPGGKHMEITENHAKQACVRINEMPPVNSLRPCADVMYASLEKLSIDNILCVVLTGMGADGTKGIEDLQKHKNIYVITESQETCVVYGMPKSVERKGLANETVPIDKISDAIIKKLGD